MLYGPLEFFLGGGLNPGMVVMEESDHMGHMCLMCLMCQMYHKILSFDLWYIIYKVEYNAILIQVKCFIYLFLGGYICAMFLNSLKNTLCMILSTVILFEKYLYMFCIIKIHHENGS